MGIILYFDSSVRNMAPSRDGKSVKEWVDDCIGSKPVVVFSKSYCPFCDMAKNALKQAGITDYLLIELENREDCRKVHWRWKRGTTVTSSRKISWNGITIPLQNI